MILKFFSFSFLIVLSNCVDFTKIFNNFISMGQEQMQHEVPSQENLLEEYDFIIVGAGSAGCVLAARLSENPNWKILLLEAGRGENFVMDIPMMVHFLQQYDINWKYKTEPSQTSCLAMKGKELKFRLKIFIKN